MLNFNQFRIVSTIGPSDIAVLSVDIEVNVLVCPFLVIGDAKIDFCRPCSVFTLGGDYDVVPLVGHTNNQTI